jgi:hypothetical protein
VVVKRQEEDGGEKKTQRRTPKCERRGRTSRTTWGASAVGLLPLLLLENEVA